MKKYFIACIFLILLHPVHAQKKVVPVTQSALTSVTLPAGSTQDKRMLMEMSGKILLEMESKKAGTTITTLEILYLPSVATCGFTADSLVAQLSTLGWSITPVEADNKYVWLQKDNRFLLTYLSTGKKQTDLYFGEASNPPAFATGVVPQQDSQQQQQNQ